ncbi:MAG: hypothetical protein Q8N18_26695 [Opitutaceae bacterium]|nr:hypothetical protein [Opitutaceae bacterium]
MKPVLSHSFAVLALFAAVPSAHALTITQNLNVNYGGSYQGSPVFNTFGYTWESNRFDPQLGTLLSVSITALINETLTVVENNAFFPNQAMIWTPIATMQSTMGYSIGTASSALASATGSTQSLNYQQYGFFTTQLSNSLAATITDAASLAGWQRLTPWVDNVNVPHSGIPVDFRTRYYGEEGYGNVTANGTLAASITYTYQVSDHGITLVFFSASFLGLLAFSRHRLA